MDIPLSTSPAKNLAFDGRDWQTIKVAEVVDPAETRFVELDTTVEQASKLLVTSGSPNVVLVRQNSSSKSAIGVFGYNDLLAYLLLVTELSVPRVQDPQDVRDLLTRARNQQNVTLAEIQALMKNDDERPVLLDQSEPLTKAVEIFASGVHRILITKSHTEDVLCILTQLRLARFLWENVANFNIIESLHAQTLKDLEIGSRAILYVNGDRPLKEALLLMHTQSMTSLPVVDNHHNVLGNISHVDVKLLTTTSALPLLEDTCLHFVSVILSERGVNAGQDSFPVFYVSSSSTLALTVAKIVATRSHRMWIVGPPSPSSSALSSTSSSKVSLNQGLSNDPLRSRTNSQSDNGVSTSGFDTSGHLTGVVSLTDIFNLYATTAGLDTSNPYDQRRRRRASIAASFAPRDTIAARIDSLSPGNPA